MPIAHKPHRGSNITIQRGYRVPDAPRKLADLDPEVRAWIVENERYVQAGAGKKTKAGLCMGYTPGDDLCAHNSISQRNNFCRRHQHQAGIWPTRYKGTPGAISPLRKLSYAQANRIREQKGKSGISNKTLAQIYGVSEASIRNIVRHVTYRPTKLGKRNMDW